MKQLSITTWDLHYDERATKPLFGIFSWAGRAPMILKELLRIDSDIILIQEIPQFYTAVIRTELSEYTWGFAGENYRGGKTMLGIGVKTSAGKPTFSEYDFRKVGRHGEKVLFAKLGDILIGCVHFPKNILARRTMSDKLGKVLKNFIYRRLIIGGNFNSATYDGGGEQIHHINAVCGTYSATEYTKKESNDTPTYSSFSPYPYNVINEKYLNIPGKLDHILVRNFIAGESILHDIVTIHQTSINLSEHYAITTYLTL